MPTAIVPPPPARPGICRWCRRPIADVHTGLWRVVDCQWEYEGRQIIASWKEQDAEHQRKQDLMSIGVQHGQLM